MAATDSSTVLITGCSSGIGYAAAHRLKARGYRVFATARKSADVARLNHDGLESLQLDLADSASIHAAVDEILERTGGTVYGVFNNAGYGQPGAVEDLSRDALRDQFETNVFGTHELNTRLIPVMRAQGYGRIIQNSSVLGLIALPYRGAYNASKFALEGLYDTLRLELAGTGIQVSLVEPGPIESRFRANSYAMYQRTIDAPTSVHRQRYESLIARLNKEGAAAPFTLPPEAVVKKVIHALESSRPRIRYYVTFPTYLFATLKRVLPWRTLDRVLLGVGRGERQRG
ncbi:MAG TPA: SDR family oxidoreductase [Gammaproteobacteria bacterium]|nr:SDR family oxidoreductase [Gammaproteobacteria bacterium]